MKDGRRKCLKEAVEEIDVDSCEAIMVEWERKSEDIGER